MVADRPDVYIPLFLAQARKTRILDVVYNASNNELVRTKTLVKNCIVVVDAAPFRQWYEQHYGLKMAGKGDADKESKVNDQDKSALTQEKHASRRNGHVLDAHIRDQLAAGRILACVSSRPGQCGRCDGYLLEGRELEFYQRKLATKKQKK